MPIHEPQRFAVDCPSRILFDQIADKWSMMVLTVLDAQPLRFNEIRRRLEGVSQKALTECLRRLERNGLLTRHVLATSPVSVEYEISALGRKLQKPFKALYAWTVEYLDEVETARRAYDERTTSANDARRERQPG
ncbi:MarR family transcriptional regulator [Pandoraea vervacti]|uniref:MarR family transcriptional regulator n=1 Tax=Pandoraea vervacti TaxID=656178 RepID=A0ABM5SUX4_9BURK|nr:helix-turn-helix domain-containing protein [Pandoraea vervacti]AJP56275.1 MarR family transcriptional regulator [Pandoraea vervacti]